MKATRGLVGALAAMVLCAPYMTAQSGESAAKSFLWMQCNQDVLSLDLDPVPLRQYVGSAFSVGVVKGKARVLIVVKACPTYWIDGQDVGPTREVHEWVAIDGPADVRPVVGAQRTFPTSTWVALFVGSTNARSRSVWSASGTAAIPIEALHLDAPASRRGGRVTVGAGLSYSWEAESKAPFARLIGVNHDVYSRDDRGKIFFNRIQVLLNVFAWDSPATLKVLGATNPTKLIGSGTYAITVHTFRPMWARVSLGDSPPK